MAYLGSMGVVDAEAIESNAVNAGIKRGQEAVINNTGAFATDEDAFYAGFAEGYNNYMESINSQIFIGLNDARKKVTYKKTQPTQDQNIFKDTGSAQYGKPVDVDTGLKFSDPGYGFSSPLYGADDSSSSVDSGSATVTVNTTGQTTTITTKKSVFNPMLIAGIAAAALAVYIVLKKD